MEKNRVSLEDLDAVIRAFESLQQQGKVRAWGITGMGASEALQEAVARGGFQTIRSLQPASISRQVHRRLRVSPFRTMDD